MVELLCRDTSARRARTFRRRSAVLNKGEENLRIILFINPLILFY